ESVAFGDDRELTTLLVQPGVRDRDRRVRREQLGQLLVEDAELLRAFLLREVERADHAFARDDRYAEERPHVRMTARPVAGEAWTVVDVRRAERFRRLEDRAEHPVGQRQWAERGDELVAHARGEERAEAALVVRHAERGVARVDERARVVDEALEHLF